DALAHRVVREFHSFFNNVLLAQRAVGRSLRSVGRTTRVARTVSYPADFTRLIVFPLFGQEQPKTYNKHF
ncbi:hypothetical protein QMO17_32035, partial [Klebsiella pneumoniae]|nr:hypothetical protein [Klebsiella pneumoniae]